jgi:hypothetical protein
VLQRQHRDTQSVSSPRGSLLRRLGQATILAAPSKTANQTSSSATADSTRKYAAVRDVLNTVKMAIGDGSGSGSRVPWRTVKAAQLARSSRRACARGVN